MLLKLFTVLITFSTVAVAEPVKFFYQPNESAGTDCWFKPSGQPHGYLVYCGSHEFSIHHFARPFVRADKTSWELLFLVTNRKAVANEYQGSTMWINAKPGAQITDMKLSQVVDGDTATLDMTIELPPVGKP